ncbi:TIGR04211 family SH3 domain-containing protein [Saccharophagus degradans]|uniref:TIGR04211 family SH3 domain-containing protein n=1 Tax=Saccharophagus degradans TaxID=86304 RepID=A0AAW7X9V6_9GAMM|nr:TIGR04211 family SH3 domain-containing protein [Saccharophagus degradans]MDO6424209.1 TIGR04211 family SH3 domain-containing protein [Saccharophagus degradans]MDO6608256.1 TIGR04211 family SH3 domain-containing protein [Saccharophagus degradans]
MKATLNSAVISLTKQLNTRTIRCLLICSALIASLATSSQVAAKTVYISDILYVPLRSGAGNQYRIINSSMKSGTALTHLKDSEDGEWAFVRTGNSSEGWIRSQYLVDEEPARDRLAKVQTELAKLKKQNASLAEEAKQLSQENASLKSSASAAMQEQSSAQSELERIRTLSEDAINLEKRYQDLLEKHQLLKTERDSLEAENEQLINSQELNFMFYGAGLLILGMLLAVILPMIKRKKGYSDWAH